MKLMKRNNVFFFLKPRLLNVLLMVIVLCLPLLRERVVLPEGGYEVAVYRPIFLLASYLQMQDWPPFFLMVGFSLVIYFVVSVVVAIIVPLWKRIKKLIT